MRDFVAYAAFSAIAYASAIAVRAVLPSRVPIEITVFGIVYVALVAVFRWRPRITPLRDVSRQRPA